MNTENNIEPVKAGVKPYMFWIAFVSVLGGLLFGFDTAVISGAERLRYKESDRIESVVSNLRALGAEVTETEDGMIIHGGKQLKGARLKGFNDHRILMAFSVAALAVDGNIEIDDAQSINKSYPSYFEDYNMLGGKANVI